MIKKFTLPALLMSITCFSAQTLYAASPIEFTITQKSDPREIACTFLKIKEKQIFCNVRRVETSYPLSSINSIKIVKKNKEYVLQNITQSHYNKVAQAVNMLNKEKISLIAAKKRQIKLAAQRKKEAEEQQQKRSNWRYKQARSSCEQECAVTQYSYDKVCYSGCMNQVRR